MGTEARAPLPRYGEASLADVVPSLLSAWDVPGFANPLGIEPAQRVCMLVIDGLGLEGLEANREQALFLTTGAASVQPITTCFPATTVASLGSLGTGQPPGEHGLVGMTVALPGQQRAMNLLRWAAYGPGQPPTCATASRLSASSPSRPPSSAPRLTASASTWLARATTPARG